MTKPTIAVEIRGGVERVPPNTTQTTTETTVNLTIQTIKRTTETRKNKKDHPNMRVGTM
jgi:hypothetical protein